MGHDHSHAPILDRLVAHLQPVMQNAHDGVYLFLDDKTQVCNDKCAKLFGYANPAAWAKATPFLDKLVAPEGQNTVAQNFGKHIAGLHGPTRFTFKAKKADGTTFNCETDMIPLAFEGHVVAYHFVRAGQ